LAAGIAWYLPHDLLDHRNAFFAPTAAVIVLGLSPVGGTRRTAEMVVGVAAGIAVGELLIEATGLDQAAAATGLRGAAGEREGSPSRPRVPASRRPGTDRA
jgi:uncharacterized membrane protein YgaE (UPF0421/DUF939 family)